MVQNIMIQILKKTNSDLINKSRKKCDLSIELLTKLLN